MRTCNVAAHQPLSCNWSDAKALRPVSMTLSMLSTTVHSVCSRHQSSMHQSGTVLSWACVPSCLAATVAVLASLPPQHRLHSTCPPGMPCHLCPNCQLGLTAAEDCGCKLLLPVHAWQPPALKLSCMEGYKHNSDSGCHESQVLLPMSDLLKAWQRLEMMFRV